MNPRSRTQKPATHSRERRRAHLRGHVVPPGAASFALAIAAVAGVPAFAVSLVMAQAASAATEVQLGTSSQFAVLAGAGVTNTGSTTIRTQGAGTRGDGGTFPNDTVTGAASVSWMPPASGSWHKADEVAQKAQDDNLIAYDAAAGAASSGALGAQLDGVELIPGVYTASSALDLATNGTVTFNAEGDPNAEFIIQVGSSLTMGVNSSVALTNGAQACHIFWQVSADATIKTDSDFVGTLLARNAIVAQSGATIDGRLLAQVASVTLDNNTFVVPACRQVIATTPTGTTTTGTTPTGTTPTGTTPTGTTPTGTTSTATTARETRAVAAETGTETTSGPHRRTGPGLPDTGGPSPLILPAAMFAVAGGSILLLLSRPKRGADGSAPKP